MLLAMIMLLGALAVEGEGVAEGEGEAPPSYTEALDALGELAHDETAYVEALRSFDSLFSAMAANAAQQAQTLAAQGEDELAEETFERARAWSVAVREAYERALEVYPRNGLLRNYYGELLYDHYGDHAKALSMWKQAIALDEDQARPYNNLAIHYSHVGEYRLSLQHFDEALERDPTNADYHFNIAQIYLIHGPQTARIREWEEAEVYEKAMDHSARAVKLAPYDYDILEDYAVNYYAGENFGVEVNWRDGARAWQQARPLARTEEETFYCWLNEARAWLRAGRNGEALAAIDEALALRPDSVAAQTLRQRATGGEGGA